jgi:hypothetical protein
MLIPFIGAFASIAPPLIAFVLAHVANLAAFPVVSFVLLFIFLVVAQHIVMNLLAPRVMSSTIGMHPLLVLLGLLLGAKLAGLWGAIFGVPVLGVILDTIDVIYRRVMRRRYGFEPVPVTDLDDENKTGRGPGAPESTAGAPPPPRAPRQASKRVSAALRRAGAALRPPPRPGNRHV